MHLITTPDINKARAELLKLKKDNPSNEIAVLSQDDEFNRKALELKGISIFIINENYPQKDYSKQRSSCLNEFLAKEAAKSKISIGIQIEEIIKKSSLEKARSLARLQQNIMLLKKAGAKIIFLESKSMDKRALQALLLSLGASTKQAFESIK